MTEHEQKQELIVLVEDDQELSDLITQYLESKNYQVIQVLEGISAVDTIISNNPDVVILDLMLPGKDGMTICKEARYGYTGNILVLTASDDVFDHVTALEIGADDFIQKPVEPRVLLAHIRALTRRHQPVTSSLTLNKPQAEVIQLNQLMINTSARQVYFSNSLIELTTPEFDVLLALAERAGHVVSRDELFKSLKNLDYDGENRFIDITVSSIRRKMGAGGNDYLKTVRGKGYLIAIN